MRRLTLVAIVVAGGWLGNARAELARRNELMRIGHVPIVVEVANTAKRIKLRVVMELPTNRRIQLLANDQLESIADADAVEHSLGVDQCPTPGSSQRERIILRVKADGGVSTPWYLVETDGTKSRWGELGSSRECPIPSSQPAKWHE